MHEPRSFDPAHQHELIQKEMATWCQIFLDGLTCQIYLARDPNFREQWRQETRDCLCGPRALVVRTGPHDVPKTQFWRKKLVCEGQEPGHSYWHHGRVAAYTRKMPIFIGTK